MTKTFQNADDLVKYCIDNNILAGQVWVESNPYGKGGRQLLWFYISYHNNINTYFVGQGNINGIDYTYTEEWHHNYKGTFELVLPFTQHTKPEVYPVGTLVEVLESARECGSFWNWDEEKKAVVGKRYKIDEVFDDFTGIYYRVAGYTFPHYCIRKVEESEQQVELTLDQIAERFGVDVKNLKIKK